MCIVPYRASSAGGIVRSASMWAGALSSPSSPCACRKSNPDILVVQPAENWAAKNMPGPLDGARDRRILLQGETRTDLVVVFQCTAAVCDGDAARRTQQHSQGTLVGSNR